MRIALVIGANPKHFEAGALVPVPAGEYRIVREGMVDSDIGFRRSDCSTPFLFADACAFDIDVHLSVHLMKAGSEEFFNVFLEAA